MIIKNCEINLYDTITCGQAFRWFLESDDSFTIILKDRVVNLKQINKDIHIKSSNMEDIINIVSYYLDLITDYNEINRVLLNNDSNLEKYINSTFGFKILNQDPLEMIVSYIISQNNHLRNIMKSVNLLSERYGKQIIFENKKYYLFPTLNELSLLSIENFRNIGVGFRDKYLVEVIKNIKNNDLDLNYVNELNGEAAMKYLCLNKGIGPKVASCILLFSYNKYDVFPIDTWIKKFFLNNYPNVKNTEKEISKYSKEKYGKYSGIVLQYFFHYERNKN